MFKSLLLVLLTLALLGSLVLNYFFYSRAFMPLQSARLDPVGLEYYPSTETPEKPSNKTSIMFYGDSRALSWPASNTTDYRVINRAIGNQTSTQILQRFDRHAAPHKPELILIQMCVNDLKMIPLFPRKRDQIIQDCKDNIRSLLDKAQKIESTVILTTVFPLGDVSFLRKGLGTREAPIIDGITQINDYIRAQASDYILIFDSYAMLAGENRKINPDYSKDWLHLNNKGYQRLNTDLKQFLEQIMSK